LRVGEEEEAESWRGGGGGEFKAEGAHCEAALLGLNHRCGSEFRGAHPRLRCPAKLRDSQRRAWACTVSFATQKKKRRGCWERRWRGS
jgi:hypothetical protein